MTALVRKKRLLVYAAVLLIGVAIFGFAKWYDNHTKMSINGAHFSYEIAGSPSEKAKGLSGRSYFASDQAMLFTYKTSSSRCFWMKDMLISLDIVWLDDQNRVSAIEHNVGNETYPKEFCHTGRDVIEFAAGTATGINLKIGDQVDL